MWDKILTRQNFNPLRLERSAYRLYDLRILSGRQMRQDNILIGKNGVPKITDFGLSRMDSYSYSFLMTSQTSQDQTKGTLPWLAYEIVAGTGTEDTPYTKASDMWAFGMIVLV